MVSKILEKKPKKVMVLVKMNNVKNGCQKAQVSYLYYVCSSY